MPQAILKPIEERTPGGRYRGYTIESMAEQAAAFYRLYRDMDAAQGLAESARDALAKKNDLGDDHSQLCQTVNRIERIGAAAYERYWKLKDLIYELEPRTLDEVLTLALAIGCKVDDLKVGSVDGEAEWKALVRAIGALIRGLVGSGATSPLLDLLVSKSELVSWEDEAALAEADAKRFLKDTTL